ncbi:MAG TPA: hypothetical protein VK797_26095 [Tepidisphaeraceae bacterium]|nr:hypothetical protein [Tepidisphaeraceae bacterium]
MSAVAVGLAIQIQDGEYTPVALGLLTIALLLTGMAVCARRLGFLPDRWFLPLLVSCILVEFGELFITWPGVDLPRLGGWQLAPFFAGLLVALGCVFVGWIRRLPPLPLGEGGGEGKCDVAQPPSAVFRRKAEMHFDLRSNTAEGGCATSSSPTGRRGKAAGASPSLTQTWFPFLVATHLLLSIWMIRSSPNPHIDVWVFQQDASDALLHGRNPYSITFPDIYHSTFPGHQQVYGNGLVVNDRLQFGFPYPPVSLLLASLGYAIAHDHRYAQACAMAVSGLLIGYSRPGVVSKLAAALLLFTPRIFFVLGRAWTEPFTIMLLAATVFLACRRSRFLPIALGLLLATKQYMVLALPISFFLLPPGWKWRDGFNLLWQSALVACAVTLPLALLDFHAFGKSTVTVQELAPFRWDALSYLVWYGFRGHLVTEPFTALFWSTLAAVVTLALSLWRAPRTPAGFALSLGFILLAFFAFNKQAFCNYYFFVIGAMCCAVGALELPALADRSADAAAT